jgi:uncharacterized protein
MNELPADVPSVFLGFRAENVRSFRDELQFSMLATTLAETDVARDVTWREGGSPIGVLPAAGIFGANASGKSNVLRAMSDMRSYVLHSFRRGSPTGGIPRQSFLLDDRANTRSSRFEIDVVLCGVRHEYGFVFDDERVIEEWATRYPHGRAATIFERVNDRVNLGSVAKPKGRAVTELLRPNALFLSTAASANHPVLLPLYGWFERNLILAEARSRDRRQALTTKMLDDPKMRERVLMFLRAADLGITGASKHELDPEMRERLERAVRILVGEEGEPDDGKPAAQATVETYGVRLKHRGAVGEVEFESDDESLGTLVWFGLVGPVIKALSDGSTFLADELDASLHPALVAQLIALFQSPETNPRRAQLVFNSHDTTILGASAASRAGVDGQRLLGRDQVWFTEKSNDGATRLYPLTDLDPRKDEALERRYLDGRYGATPILSRPQFEETSRLVASAGGAPE